MIGEDSNYDAHASESTKLGPLPILRAKTDPDPRTAGDIETMGKGDLFVVFGEPDIWIRRLDGDRPEVKGVAVFDSSTATCARTKPRASPRGSWTPTPTRRASSPPRRLPGRGRPLRGLEVALRAEIDEAAGAALHRATSRAFPRRIAVGAIDHFGDAVMKVCGA